jgi:ribosomal-protein-alanine N-acetyltransferase
VANLAVNQLARGRGIGRALLERIIEDLSRRGVRALYLEVRVSNATALGLYARVGFSEVGRRERYYTHPVEDALVLRLGIS